MEKNVPKTVRAWYFYDWANSVYSLVITSSLFPIYYKNIAQPLGGGDMVDFFGFHIHNSSLYSYALSFSFLIVAVMLPLLSGVADYSGKPLSFMKFFVLLGSLACMGLYFFDRVDRLEWGIFCSMLASIGYSSSLVFYDAFLPQIVTQDRIDSTSAKGYAMGYYGSVIMMVFSLMVISWQDSPEWKMQALRLSFVMVGLWWIGFSLVPFYYLSDTPRGTSAKRHIWKKGYQEIVKVFKSLKGLRDLRRFLVAYFFYNSGVQTVMYMAIFFGTDVFKLKDDNLIMVVLTIQLVGAFGARFFAWLSDRKGNRYVLATMLWTWIGICIGAYYISSEAHFYGIAFLIGMVMGGIQSLSRATYAKLIPTNSIDHASYFSFYDVTFNLSIVVGVFIFGLINQWTDSMRNSTVFLCVFFMVGLGFLLSIRDQAIRIPTKRVGLST